MLKPGRAGVIFAVHLREFVDGDSLRSGREAQGGKENPWLDAHNEKSENVTAGDMICAGRKEED